MISIRWRQAASLSHSPHGKQASAPHGSAQGPDLFATIYDARTIGWVICSTLREWKQAEELDMPDKDEQARKRAEAHYRVEVGTTRIFRIAGTAETESRLTNRSNCWRAANPRFRAASCPCSSAPRRRVGFTIRR